MITLHTFGPACGLPDPSPFVMKVMALLEIAGLPYEFKSADPRKGPKGKIPWLVDGDHVVADSTFIQWYLEKTYGIDFYPGLDAREKAIGWTVEKMCQDHLYFCGVHERWVKEENFDKGRDSPSKSFRPSFPPRRLAGEDPDRRQDSRARARQPWRRGDPPTREA